MKRKKWTPEAIEKAKKEVRSFVDDGGMTVKEAMKEVGIDPTKYYGTVRKTKEARPKRTYKKREVTVSEIAPIKLSGGKTVFIITDDSEVIAKMLERYV